MNNQTELYEFIMAQAHKLAARYNNSQMYDDLKSEAVLVGLELLAVGETQEKVLLRNMRTRVNDYANLGQLPVYVPPSGPVRTARAALASGKGSEGIEWPLLQALLAAGGVSNLDDNLTASTEDTAEAYERKDELQHIWLLAEQVLEDRDYHIFSETYFKGETQEAIAKQLDITQQRVEQILERALTKLQEALDV